MTGHDFDAEPIEAGSLAAWLIATRAAIRGAHDADVPCGSCTACCRSSQFVLVTPADTDARVHIPRELLFPAPLMPKGYLVLGYDEHGRCPMLTDAGCSIYEYRPRTCRTYDCRIFAATGVELDDPDQADIAARAKTWRFEVASDADRAAHDALHAALTHLRDHPGDTEDPMPTTPTQLAVAAVEISGRVGAPRVDRGEGV